MPQPSAKPLAGIRVVTLAEQYPGPYATLLLADLGAEVVIVEPRRVRCIECRVDPVPHCRRPTRRA